jgi:hypothetical protein
LTVFETYRLSSYEECTGVLNKLHVENGLLIALIDKISLALPLEMAEKMRPHIGKRVSILHVDIASKPYLLRVIPDERLNDQGRALDRSSDYGFQDGE